MTRIRWFLVILFAVTITVEVSAQVVPPPVPVIMAPVILPNGIDLQYKGRRLKVGAFIPTGGYTSAVLPFVPTGQTIAPGQPIQIIQPYPPFPAQPYFPGYPNYYYPFYSTPFYGAADNVVTLQIINPPGLGQPRRGLALAPPLEEVDISGIDLDVEPAAKIWNNKPNGPQFAAKGKAAKKVEVAKAPPPEERKVAAKVAANAPKPAQQVAPPVAPKPQPVPLEKRQLDAGMTAFREGEYGIAALRFRQLAEADPPMTRALFLLGQAGIAVGKYQEAIQNLQQGLQRQPNWVQSGFRPKAELYGNDAKRWQQHLTRLEETNRLQPKNADYLFLLGYVAWFDGQRKDAVDYFRQARALAADPQWCDLFLQAAN
jgi:hypothetical protein